jgi:alpha-tubulin suppressor-like RCC1 family protein
LLSLFSAAHTAIITLTGALLTCGYGRFGRLGHGDETPRLSPCRVAALASERVVAVAAADDHTAAVTETGALYTFGYGGFGQLATAGDAAASAPGALVCRTLPVRVLGPLAAARVVAVAAGGYHTVALDAQGQIWTAGWAAYGTLGRDDPGNGDTAHDAADAAAPAAIRPAPARVTGGALARGARVRQVAAGCHHSLCVMDDGSAVAFGRGAGGRLGHGSEADAPLPIQVPAVRLPVPRWPPHIVLLPPLQQQREEEKSVPPCSPWGTPPQQAPRRGGLQREE